MKIGINIGCHDYSTLRRLAEMTDRVAPPSSATLRSAVSSHPGSGVSVDGDTIRTTGTIRVKPYGYTQHADSRFLDNVMNSDPEACPIASIRLARAIQSRVESGETIQWAQDTAEPTMASEAPSRIVNIA